ncbi:GMC family oxidoreductase N-terminal domain-containing protein [Ensifer adhaerens]|uniref:GMC family oxidoreductase n=1 Tax=Ensifer adhaerens TaxID=106592 RepID=UPI001CC143AA|nr:GMC family oxidoreductase N-terminal domain-containing protein [Ensifer adhaerens]MBZ7925072.1 GMC family oxidoreductase N-terminal domain-containing protein [Ensifer adhaerens]UAX95737.1 GMC family oxidoreductase N-terminal domain-containing protein [Ensifer adhaerens]UAY04922.1 GMC family oxidoreductase N-terminal domain-containing protein [Ensifer adhaerens]UAY10354.1 GMC family oxidoreductase N-terminal domain-containing protein [Ensifer adhaerens]
MIYDYIIVGAGSAGCILASRLSENGRHKVLLIEAGGNDNSFWFKIPVGYARSYYNPAVNWMYSSEPEAELQDRSIYVPRGKVQGGSGSINAMIYVRGARDDFDDWKNAGNAGWGYDDVLSYFRRLETHARGSSEWHGGEGPIHITPMRGMTHPITDAFLESCGSLQLPLNEDFNGASIEGAGVYDVNTNNGRRSHSSAEYLRPALKRPNLTIERYAQAERLVFGEDGRVTGVDVIQNGKRRRFTAGREVILAAGAVGSPQLLQVSGIGDGKTLSSLGVETRRHMPAVGQNLQDHLCASFYYRATIPTLNDEFGSLFGQMRLGLQYLLTGKGPFSMSVNQAGGFFRGRPDEERPNIQLYFNPLSYRIPTDPKAGLRPEPYPGYLICFNSCRPTSRGSISIASGDPSVKPLIRPNYLTTDRDIDEVLQGSRLVRRIASAAALSSLTAEEISPAPRVESDEALMDYFRENSGSIYHLCGTCAMGPDQASSVVDSRLKVHGVPGLRVVDASIFPNITAGNINAPTMMVAEKGADLILADAA